MATIFAVTSFDLNDRQKKELSDALISDIGEIFTHALAFNMAYIPQENCRGQAVDQITFFVCVPPYIALEKKRRAIECFDRTVKRVVGCEGFLKVIVLFQYHDDDGVGKDGELFSDIKARQNAQ